MEKLLVFAPHPDDDVIGCGGTIARYIAQGNQAAIVYVTSGEAGSLTSNSGELSSLREEEATQAAALLGVSDLVFLRQPDGYISWNQKLVETLVSIIRSRQPSMVFLPNEEEAVRDHQQSSQIILEACKRAAGPWFPACGEQPWSVDKILAYEVWTPLSRYNLTVDISDFMQLKLAALRQHGSQLADIAYDEAVQGLNRYRGVTSGTGQYAECFQLIKTTIQIWPGKARFCD
jgi:LmbE family N-acetylglucosaminyl deacetylase